MLMMGFRRMICEPPAAIGASGQRSLSPRTVSADSRRVLPAVAAQTEKVGPVKRTLPRLLHTRPREGLSFAASSFSGPGFTQSSPPAARSPSPRSLAIDAGLPTSHNSRRRPVSYLPPNRSRTSLLLRRGSHAKPVFAVASSADPQQHGRVGHGARTALVGDGRIGYWYTNSRSPEGRLSLRRAGDPLDY